MSQDLGLKTASSFTSSASSLSQISNDAPKVNMTMQTLKGKGLHEMMLGVERPGFNKRAQKDIVSLKFGQGRHSSMKNVTIACDEDGEEEKQQKLLTSTSGRYGTNKVVIRKLAQTAATAKGPSNAILTMMQGLNKNAPLYRREPSIHRIDTDSIEIRDGVASENDSEMFEQHEFQRNPSIVENDEEMRQVKVNLANYAGTLTQKKRESQTQKQVPVQMLQQDSWISNQTGNDNRSVKNEYSGHCFELDGQTRK